MKVSEEEAVFSWPEDLDFSKRQLIIGNYDDDKTLNDKIPLKPYEAKI